IVIYGGFMRRLRNTNRDSNKPRSDMEGSDNPTFRQEIQLSSNPGDYGAVPKDNSISIRSLEHAPTRLTANVPMPAESSYVLFFQVLFPFMIAGFGMVLAGIVLDIVQHWELFKQVPEAFILVPALLGLKGNLEMTLASRLSTQANMGRMDSKEQIITVVVSNVALIQVQAIVVTFLASGFAMVLAWIPKGEIDWGHASLLCASSLTTASLASFILSDLTTLAILASFGSMFLKAHLTDSWMNVMVIVAFVLAIPIWATAACRDGSTRAVLEDGWSPIIFSMLLSSGGGLVLEKAIKSFKQMALFQPVINGVGGNLAAVHASRLSTFFHKNAEPGLLPNGWTIRRFTAFKRAFFSSDWDARSARVLLFLVIPGHIVFNWLIALLHTGENPPSSALFTSLYLTAAIIQVTVLLFICQWLVAFMWACRVDPDNAAIPYLTALGDLIGTSLLYLAFVFLHFVKDDEIIKTT
ncbi:hypothetical protein FO519_003508, partial [Halicephalobus sp. NKZ332]